MLVSDAVTTRNQHLLEFAGKSFGTAVNKKYHLDPWISQSRMLRVWAVGGAWVLDLCRQYRKQQIPNAHAPWPDNDLFPTLTLSRVAVNSPGI